jgi:hypothetical protein
MGIFRKPVIALVVGLMALPLIGRGHLLLGLGFILASRVIAFFSERDAALDAVFFASLPFAFALDDVSRALAANFVLFGFVVFVAIRRIELIAEFVATLGFALACIFPERFGLVAYTLGIASFVFAGLAYATRNQA